MRPNRRLYSCAIKSTDPETFGVAIEVPLIDPYEVVETSVMEYTEAPFATMSGFTRPSSQGPQLEKEVCTTSAGTEYPRGMSLTAPTVSTFFAMAYALMVS
jgi:hypothetical protein